jgi:hypothetical protein
VKLSRALLQHATPCALLWASLGLPVLAGADASTAPVSQSALHACAVIATASERLACYDQLAGRPAQNSGMAAAPAPASAPVAPLAGAPVAAPAAPTAAAAAAAPPPPASFGLYSAEHPLPPLAPTQQAHVVSTGTSAGGRMTVTLDTGGLWELEDGDPLLAVGDMVTLRRASLGSFMMDTPSKRSHRVRRLH